VGVRGIALRPARHLLAAGVNVSRTVYAGRAWSVLLRTVGGHKQVEAAKARRAVDAAISTVSSLGLTVDDAVVLSDSYRLVVHLTPCDVIARVTLLTHVASAELEVELAQRLMQTDSPVAALEARVGPRVFVRDGFKITMWTYVEPVQSRVLPPADYAQALERLHAGLRQLDFTTPHVMDRIAATQRDVASRDVTPELADADRALLADTLRDLGRSIANRRAPEQLLHGEPHPGNVLDTKNGPLFIDFENTAEGPVEYDIAWVPQEVAERYPNADEDLVGDCRGVVLAIIATHRWSRGDQHPSGGRKSGLAFLNALRDGPPWPALDEFTW
jgi:aminoglycoside phosphotransferase (APT) family kinase protein